MPHESASRTPRRPDVWLLLACTTWAALVLAVCTRSAVQIHTRNLYPTWITAGADWLHGKDFYRNEIPPYLEAFRYGPTVAAGLAPWALLPERPGNVLWRLFNAGVFLGGFLWWLRKAAPVQTTARQQGIMFLLAAPLALGSLNNGQPNPLLVGCLLVAMAAVAEGRWNLASLVMAGAVVLKLYPVALALLLVAAYPRKFGPRFVVALLLLLALPYLLQDPGYVSRQYELWWTQRLRTGDEVRRFWPTNMAYRDLWLLIRVARLPVSLAGYTALQLGLAAACVGLCVAARLRFGEPRRVLEVVLTTGTCWMILCGPATESPTYVVAAPVLAWGWLRSWARPWPLGPRLAAGLGGLCLLAGVLAGLSRNAAALHGLGPHPLGVLLFTAGYLGVLVPELVSPATPNPTAAPLTPHGSRAA